jgi:hypothetical protein
MRTKEQIITAEIELLLRENRTDEATEKIKELNKIPQYKKLIKGIEYRYNSKTLKLFN